MTPRPADDTPSPADDAGLAARLAAAKAAFSASHSHENWLAVAEAELPLLNRSVALAPDDPKPRLRRARNLVSLGRAVEALPDLDLVIAATPRDPDAWDCRADAYWDLGRLEDALTAYDVLVELPKKHGEGIHRLQRAHVLSALGRFDGALAALASLLADKPEYAAAYDEKGHILRQTGRYAEAVEAYTRSLDEFDDDDSTFVNRAVCHAYLGNAAAALADVAEARKVHVDEEYARPDVLYDIACVYALLGDLPAAFVALTEAKAKGFDDVASLENDPDLDKLRESPQFRTLLTEVRGG